jgi:hypothetical protein
MLKDTQPGYALPLPNALNIAPTAEVDKVLAFVDKNISGFCSYYKSIEDSSRENRISDFLVHHLQLCKEEQSGGFFPYDFRKNPTQQHSGKETDIGVFVLTRGTKPVPIIEFEAKRFSASSNNKEYVCGERGGIERFKRGQHSSHLSICGMFAYIQSNTSTHWIQKVNSWIEELSTNNVDTSIDWASNEKLVALNTFTKIEQFQSEHSRMQSSNTIKIRHYFIELC